MGFGGIGPGSLILILVIVVLLFGTKKLKTLGTDLGSAIKGFKSSVSDEKTNIESKPDTDADFEKSENPDKVNKKD
jgi:sec-independent protein translocase protein TatA